MNVQIRQVDLHGETRWQVDRIEDGKRKRTVFHTRDEAQAEASRLRCEKRLNGQAFTSLSAKDRVELTQAWVEATKRGISLLDVLQHLQAAPRPEVRQTCAGAVKLYADSLEAAGRAMRYVNHARWYCMKLVAGHENDPITVLTKDHILGWLGSSSGHSRRTALQRARSFVRFGVQEGWLVSDPTERIRAMRIQDKPPVILTVEQHKACLAALQEDPRLLAWYALGTLAGLRPGEAARMQWRLMDLDSAHPQLEVAAETSKKGQHRYVSLHPTAVAWLRYAKKLKSELPISDCALRRVRDRLCVTLGWPEWPQNIGRHTGASYALAHSRNALAVTEDLGHTDKVLRRHYRRAVRQETAAEFWAVLPPSASGEPISVDFTSAPQTQAIQ